MQTMVVAESSNLICFCFFYFFNSILCMHIVDKCYDCGSEIVWLFGRTDILDWYSVAFSGQL